jgi:hypothetical protein
MAWSWAISGPLGTVTGGLTRPLAVSRNRRSGQQMAPIGRIPKLIVRLSERVSDRTCTTI